MTKSFVTIFVIIMMAMAVTLIRAQPAHSFAIWMLTCQQEAQAPNGIQAPAILANVDPIPKELTEDGKCIAEESTCAECLNDLTNRLPRKGGPIVQILNGADFPQGDDDVHMILMVIIP